jgi:hypothetical protein
MFSAVFQSKKRASVYDQGATAYSCGLCGSQIEEDWESKLIKGDSSHYTKNY